MELFGPGRAVSGAASGGSADPRAGGPGGRASRSESARCAPYSRMQRIEWPYSTVWIVFDPLLFVVWTMLAEVSVMRT